MNSALTFIAFVLGALALLALAVWGATTAATALTLALTNAAAMATVLVLACALTATLPVFALGAVRIGALIGERMIRENHNDAPAIQLAAQPRPPMLDAPPAPLRASVPAPRTDEIQPFIPPARRIAKRAAPRTPRATRIVKRWFQ